MKLEKEFCHTLRGRIAILLMLGLTSCGGGGRQQSATLAPTPSGYDNNSNLVVNVGGAILQGIFGPTLGGLLSNTIADIISDEATSGFSSNDPDAAYFAALNNQLTSIQNQLTSTDNQINTILNTMNQYQSADQNTQEYLMVYYINNMYNQLLDILNSVNPSDAQVFAGQHQGAISAATMQYLYTENWTQVKLILPHIHTSHLAFLV